MRSQRMSAPPISRSSSLSRIAASGRIPASILALGRAVLQAIRHGRPISGGSTLTMQAARLLRGSPTHSVFAKFQQIADAVRLEWALSKSQILSLYLKLAPYGGNLEGVRAASLAYFGKEPRRLSIPEAALLVAIPQSPEARRPDRGYRSLMDGRNRVIRRAAAAHAITQADANAALSQSAPRMRLDFPAFAPHLSERLMTALPNEASIATTIDRNLQEAAETITRRNAQAFGEKISIAAIIVNNRTGEVLAHVGSAGYFDDTRLGAIDMTAAIRSPGSALKPFIYGLAFEDGLAHPETLIEDRPVRFDGYAPVNFDNVFHGTVTVRTALQLSLNIPAVKVLNEVGPVKLAARFREANMPFPLPRNLTVALGGAGLTPGESHDALCRAGAGRKRHSDPLSEGNRPRLGRGCPSGSAAARRRMVRRGHPSRRARACERHAGRCRLQNRHLLRLPRRLGRGFRRRLYDRRLGRPRRCQLRARTRGLAGRRARALRAVQRHRPAPRPLRARPPEHHRRAENSGTAAPPARLPRTEARRIERPGPGAGAAHAFPPANSEIELASVDGQADKLPVALKAEGGTLPLTWLVDRAPLASSPHRRDTFMKPASPGFVQITVVDAEGHSDRAQIRLR